LFVQFAFSEVNLGLFIFIIFAAALQTRSDGAEIALNLLDSIFHQ